MSLKQFYYKKNRIQQLRGFYYTVQTGSISQSAKKMGLSQAAITLQIQSLERDLGIKLFTRDKRKIKITKEGMLLYSHAIFYIQGLDGLFESFVEFLNKCKSNVIDIGANHASISYILPKYIKSFRQKHPEVNFKIRDLSKDEGITKLLANEIDLLIYPMFESDLPQELELIPIVTCQPVLLMNKEHPLVNKKAITLSDITKYELLKIDPKFFTFPGFEKIVKTNSLKTKIEFEISDWEILKKFVQNDIGIAMVSSIVLEGENSKDLVAKKLTNYFPEVTYGILVKKEKLLNSLLKDFIKLIKEEKLLEGQQN